MVSVTLSVALVAVFPMLSWTVTSRAGRSVSPAVVVPG